MHAMLNVRRRLFLYWIVFKFHQILVFVSVSVKFHTRAQLTHHNKFAPRTLTRTHNSRRGQLAHSRLQLSVLCLSLSLSLTHFFPQFLGFSVRSRSSLIQLKLYQLIGVSLRRLSGRLNYDTPS